LDVKTSCWFAQGNCGGRFRLIVITAHGVHYAQ
jgi:hypothetical protein